MDFEELAPALTPGLHRAAWLLTGDRHAGEDLVQETLTRLYLALRSPLRSRRPVDNPAAYARTTLVRLHIDGRRRRASTEVVTDVVPELPRSEDPTDVLALRTALAKLTPADRAVLVLRYAYDLTAAEVAADLRLTPEAVRARTSRAAARLRERLGPDFRLDSRSTP